MTEHALPSDDDLDNLFDDLFRRARRGEPDAIEELFDLIRRFMEPRARRFTKTKEEAEDITSDALIRTLVAIRAGTLNYEGRGRLYTWLGKAVRSGALDRLPERQRQILELRYVLGLSRAETAQVM